MSDDAMILDESTMTESMGISVPYKKFSPVVFKRCALLEARIDETFKQRQINARTGGHCVGPFKDGVSLPGEFSIDVIASNAEEAFEAILPMLVGHMLGRFATVLLHPDDDAKTREVKLTKRNDPYLANALRGGRAKH